MNVSRPTSPSAGAGRTGTVLHHSSAPFAALPLGGIGTGNVSIGADGALRQWQLHNIGNHNGELPDTFFCLRVSQLEPPLNVVRVLQAPAVRTEPTPLVDDDAVPRWHTELFDACQGVDRTEMRGTYPFADVTFFDDALPVSVELEAFTPLTPLAPEDSGIPAALFTFRLTNTGEQALHGWLGGAVQNAVGGDGVVDPRGNVHPGYGGNANRTERRKGWTSIVCENPSLASDDPRAGQMVLAFDSPDAEVYPQWSTARDFVEFVRTRSHAVSRRGTRAVGLVDPQSSGPAVVAGPSRAGTTWSGGAVVPWNLEVGESVQIRVVLSWYFPNRYVNFEQFGPRRPEWGSSRFWLGNHYAAVYGSATDVLEDIAERWDALHASSDSWRRTLMDSTLPVDVSERMATQAIPLRSPTCIWTGTGEFYGFEGVLGASTVMWTGDAGGSCPLNCTHVWNYEHALARLFPSLERSMRELEYDVMQAPEGYLPHRVVAPSYLPQMWGVDIGGPEAPALDGMLGSVLKAYREYRGGAGRDWLARYADNLARLMDHVAAKWDPQDTGVLRGIQPSTHDIDLRGVNSYMGTFWLAALRAMEEIALVLGDANRARWCRARFERSSAEYDRLLWNGEYYVQVLADDEPTDFQWLAGCLSDQLIGQWWAHQLDLGYLLPVEHVQDALRAVVRHNLRTGFRDFVHPFRVYADQDDTGLLMCSWPVGGRPAVPTRYADEVWSGVEYQVAAHCLTEGLADEGLAILRGLWKRHDGSRRNPYNEIECGDYYARSMAGWTVLEALTGQRYDATCGSLRFTPVLDVVAQDGVAVLPFVLDEGWGSLELSPGSATLHVRWGRVRLRTFTVPLGPGDGDVHVLVDGAPVGATTEETDDGVLVRLPEGVLIEGAALRVVRGASAGRGQE